jgi:hypothetical protein
MSQVFSQLPRVLTLTPADTVSRDAGTGKFSLLGIYNTIVARAFPYVHPSMGLYLALTDGRGKIPLVLRLIDADEERAPVFKVEATLDSSDPTQVTEAGFVLQRLEFPKPGEYVLQLSAGEEVLMERRLTVMPVRQPIRQPVSVGSQPYN